MPPDSSDKAPRRPAKKKAPAADDKPAKATKGKSDAAKPAKAADAKPRAKASPRPKAKARPTPSWRRWFLWEAVTLVGGVAAGLGITSFFLWERAERDVAAYLADPPRAVPAVIWSAPMEVRDGQPITVAGLTADLLAAKYEKVDAVTAPQQFAVSPDRVEVWTGALDVPGAAVAESRVTVELRSGGAFVKGGKATFRPTALAVLGDLEGSRSEVDLATTSKWVEPAVLAMEDRRFRQHGGIDPFGVVRAIVHDLTVSTGPAHGGSTLTQQLAKNLFLTRDRTAQRKVREAFFAAALETALDKDALLELYLSEVYLGQVGGVPIHGVEQAARAWYGVSAAHLDLGQAATIAGVISSPNTYSPVRHPDRALERRDLTLDAMVATAAITPEQAERAKAQPIATDGVAVAAGRRAPWAVDSVVDQLEDRLDGGVDAGWQIHTTIQPVLQRAAEAAVADGLAELAVDYPEANDAQIALVAVRASDGAIVAMVGSRSYAESPFNRAEHAWRQAGSTVKPLTVLLAMDRDPDLAPTTVVHDDPIALTVDGKAWTPSNYDGTFEGPITLRRAIEASRNIPAVQLAQTVGLDRLQRFLREAGLSEAHHLPAVALGAFEATPVQMAGAYTVFPGGGREAVPQLVRTVRDPQGAPVLTWAPEHVDLAEARSAALVTSLLEGVITDGTGSRAARYGVRGPVGGKSGTTSDYRDAWFVGFTPELAVAVWVGRDTGELGLSGSRAALPTWARFVVDSRSQEGAFPRPAGLVTDKVCADSGKLARPSCEITRPELFREGHVPSERCDLHGGPVVEVGRFLGGLFRRKPREEPDRPISPQ